MDDATEEGKQAMAAFVVDLISKQSPPLTDLHMAVSKFDSNSMEKIRDALINAKITSLVNINLS